MKLVASKSTGQLTVSLNGKIFNTTLTQSDSGFVLNDVQTIEINSTIIPESYVF
jgi:hypothetical protein